MRMQNPLRSFLVPLMVLFSGTGRSQALVEPVLVANVTGNNNDMLLNMTKMGSKIYFSASTPATGAELWVSDGTSAGTMMVKDLQPGSAGSIPGFFGQLTTPGTNVAFMASTGSPSESLFEMWKTNGTAAGTVKVSSVYPREFCPIGMFPSARVCFNGTSVSGSFVSDSEPWISDGTAGGTIRLNDLNKTGSSSPRYFTQVGSLVYFTATGSTVGTELYRTDGTGKGTVLVRDLISGSGSSSPANLFPLGNKLLFSVTNGQVPREFWVTSGTSSGTVKLPVINGAVLDASNPSGLYAQGSRVYFIGKRGDHTALWCTDGLKIELVTDPGTALCSRLGNYTLSGKKYYLDKDGSGKYFLWSCETSAGAGVKVPITGFTDGFTQVLFGGGVLNNRLYFRTRSASNVVLNSQLWVTDGTTAGTKLIKPANATSQNPVYDIGSPVVMNGALYYSASYRSNGFALWKVIY